MTERPSTDGQLWDYVHRLFGVGDWDEQASDVPFWKYRSKEVMKVAAKRKKLKVEVGDLANAADYCKAHRIDIRNVAWLYQYLPDSRRWMSERERALSEAALDELIAEAVDLERELISSHEYVEREGPEFWTDRLIRARGEHRREVYESWKEARNPLSTSPR